MSFFFITSKRFRKGFHCVDFEWCHVSHCLVVSCFHFMLHASSLRRLLQVTSSIYNFKANQIDATQRNTCDNSYVPDCVVNQIYLFIHSFLAAAAAMGCCCSKRSGSSAGGARSETEMSTRNGSKGGAGGGANDTVGNKQLCISRTMTQPSICIERGGTEVSMCCVVLCSVVLFTLHVFHPLTHYFNYGLLRIDFLRPPDIWTWPRLSRCWDRTRCCVLGMAHPSRTRRFQHYVWGSS
jgi:hypothetical protein